MIQLQYCGGSFFETSRQETVVDRYDPMPQNEFPDEQTLVRYLAVLRKVIVDARLWAYETDPKIADRLDQVENIPDLLARWADMNENIVITGLQRFEQKYLGGAPTFSKILVDGPSEHWQDR